MDKSSALRDLLHYILESRPEFYGNGQPYWIQGRTHCKPSSWSSDAERDRDALVTRLRKPSIFSKTTEKLANGLAACRPENRCLSGACPICLRATQRLFVKLASDLFKSVQQPYSAISIVPREGRFQIPSKNANVFRKIRTTIEQACDETGLEILFGGFDPGINEHINGAFHAHGQTQLWGFAPQDQLIQVEGLLQDAFPAKGANWHPVQIRKTFPGELNRIAYALKPDLARRVSLPRVRGSNEEMGERRNTRSRQLRVSQQCEMAIALDRAGLEARLFLRGVTIRIGENGPYMCLSTRARKSPEATARAQPPP